MNTNNIIKFFKSTIIIAVVCIVLICTYIAIFGTTDSSRIIAIGMAIGAAIGGIISTKVELPRQYKDKDERTVVITIISEAFASGLCFILTFVALEMTVTEAIPLMKLRPFMLFTIAIVAVYLITKKISYKLLNDKI